MQGRVAIVTGVSRRQGIGHAIAARLVGRGAHVFVTHHVPHDEEQPWGGDDIEAVVQSIRSRALSPEQRVVELAVDLADEGAPERVMARAVAEFGHVDVLACNHARSGEDGPLGELTAQMLVGGLPLA